MGLTLQDENLHLRIAGNISTSKKGGAWRYLYLERSMIHFTVSDSLRSISNMWDSAFVAAVLSMRSPQGTALLIGSICLPTLPSESMRHYAHGKIYNDKTFFLYRSPDIGIVWLVREKLLSHINSKPQHKHLQYDSQLFNLPFVVFCTL